MKGASLEAMSNRRNRFLRNAFGNSVSNAETKYLGARQDSYL